MNDLKMGFKHSLLQRLQHDEMSTPQPKTITEAKDPNTTQVTDFSIQKILGSNEDSMSIKTKSLTSQDTPPASPKLYAPVATKPGFSSGDILDLSKTKPTDIHRHSALLAAEHSNNTFAFSQPTNFATSFHPNILAAVAAANAQKFYAQFLPHMFPAGLYNSAVNINTRPPSLAYPKRYFAPYVLNSPHGGMTTQPSLTPPTPSSPSFSSANHLPQSSHSSQQTTTNSDCLDCLHSYYKSSIFPYKSPVLSPTASTSGSSANSYHSKTQKDLFVTSSNISLASVTNIHLSGTKISGDHNLLTPFERPSGHMAIAEEISYKCRICDKVFGCSQTLQVSLVF